MSPGVQEFQRGGAGQNISDLKDANEKYQTANEVQGGLLNIQNNLDKLPAGGYWTPGKGAADRLALAKTVNTAVQAVGEILYSTRRKSQQVRRPKRAPSNSASISLKPSAAAKRQ